MAEPAHPPVRIPRQRSTAKMPGPDRPFSALFEGHCRHRAFFEALLAILMTRYQPPFDTASSGRPRGAGTGLAPAELLPASPPLAGGLARDFTDLPLTHFSTRPRLPSFLFASLRRTVCRDISFALTATETTCWAHQAGRAVAGFQQFSSRFST